MTIETTIKDVVGGLPWAGPAGITITSDTRPAVRTWLSRMGWKTEEYLSLSLDDLSKVYCHEDGYVARRATAPDRMTAAAHATSSYAPRNENLLSYLRTKGIGTATPKADVPKTPPLPLDATPKAEPPKAAPRADNGDNADKLDAARKLLELIAGGPSTAPLDEERVIELIREHSQAPIVHQVEIKRGEEIVKIEGTQHPKLPLLAKVLSSRMLNGFALNIWMFGPTASGKTHAVEQIAHAMGVPFYMHGAMSMSHELMGYRDAKGDYLPTVMRQGFEHGGIVLCDELDSWDPQVTLALNAALANGYASFPDGMVKRHIDCIFVGCANTIGAGATADFVGRNRLDAAFMSRWGVKIAWPRDPAIEYATAGNDAWVKRVIAARNRAEAAGIKHLIDPRHSQAGAALIRAGMTMDEAAELTYLAGLADAQRRTVEGR
jgi:cobaltochelatase CobS